MLRNLIWIGILLNLIGFSTASSSEFAENSDPILVAQFERFVDQRVERVRFNANRKEPDLQRAWIEVDVRRTLPYRNDLPTTFTFKTNLETLIFDGVHEQIVYLGDSAEIETVCAEYKKTYVIPRWKFIRLGKRFIPTGNCRFKVQNVQVDFDDGFYVRKKWVTQVLLFLNHE